MAVERIPVTPASVYGKDWTDRLRELPDVSPQQGLQVGPGDAVAVVGAHPDDETFGAGATVAALARSGVRVHGLCMSAGEAALHDLGRPLGDLAERRRREYAEACRALGMASSITVGLPDGRLEACSRRIHTAVVDLAERLGAACLLTVW
jgi:LmbE family N-acetylglucosaminyl deacetylase